MLDLFPDNNDKLFVIRYMQSAASPLRKGVCPLLYKSALKECGYEIKPTALIPFPYHFEINGAAELKEGEAPHVITTSSYDKSAYIGVKSLTVNEHFFAVKMKSMAFSQALFRKWLSSESLTIAFHFHSHPSYRGPYLSLGDIEAKQVVKLLFPRLILSLGGKAKLYVWNGSHIDYERLFKLYPPSILRCMPLPDSEEKQREAFRELEKYFLQF